MVKDFFSTSINLLRCLIYHNSTRNTLFCIIVFSLLLSIFANIRISFEIYCSLLSTLAGFGLAAVAILMGMPNSMIKNLSNDLAKGECCECLHKKYNDLSNSKPIDDLFATVGLAVIIPTIGIISAFFKDINVCIDHNIIKTFFVCFSLLWEIHITLHLFSLRSYLK